MLNKNSQRESALTKLSQIPLLKNLINNQKINVNEMSETAIKLSITSLINEICELWKIGIDFDYI